MKCLVTGGAGFIGSHIVSRLLHDDHEVVVIDNESAESNDAFNWYEDDAENHVVDIRDIDACRPAFEGVEAVFHLAAQSRIQLAMNDPFDCVQTNVMGTCNMLELAREAGVERFINSSTSSCYGLNNTPPLVESMPTDCLNPYSASKVSAEKFCYMYYRLHKLRTITLRYFNVYGPRQPLRGAYAPVIGLFQEQARRGEPLTIVGDGTQRRDFTHVDDVVEANMCALNNTLSGIAVNIGTGTNYSVNEIAAMISDNVTYIAPRKGEAHETLADNTKARNMLGWEPTIDLRSQLSNV
jgi:UDP-glucose 4-epimerase|tara:strand:- start:212 stop:1099 length:888 start_codon:yes stop_codon:yes gene_type:complete